MINIRHLLVPPPMRCISTAGHSCCPHGVMKSVLRNRRSEIPSGTICRSPTSSPSAVHIPTYTITSAAGNYCSTDPARCTPRPHILKRYSHLRASTIGPWAGPCARRIAGQPASSGIRGRTPRHWADGRWPVFVSHTIQAITHVRWMVPASIGSTGLASHSSP